MSRIKGLTRRRMLASLGVGTGAFLMKDHFGISPVAAEGDDPGKLPLMVFIYFPGGWDTVISLDPRDHTQYGNFDKDIDTGYDIIAAADDQVYNEMQASSGTGLVQPAGSNILFGPAIGELKNHYEDLCVLRGVNMGTVTHEVGRRYFLTGKFPRGLSASGSALPTVLANEGPGAHAMPNLVIGGVETYNEGLDPKASGLKIDGYDDMAAVLKPIDDTLIPNNAFSKTISAYHAKQQCVHQQLNAKGAVADYRAGLERSRVFMAGELWKHFNFKKDPPAGSSIALAYDTFGINPSDPYAALSGQLGQGLIAAQALAQGVCQVVSLSVTSNLDTHFDDWRDAHVVGLRHGFDVVARLMNFLKLAEDPYNAGQSLWERVTVVGFSEFSRTPRINVRGGRDHHISNACFVAGQNIQGNQVIGGTNDKYDGIPVNLNTGELAPDSGDLMRPADIHATILTSLGMDLEHISNQEPKIIQTMLV